MKTDVDTCLKEVADWYVKNRREMTPAELEPILRKHCEGETETEKFTKFLLTEPGQLRFKTLLRERKPPASQSGGYEEKPSYLKGGPTIHEATSENPDPTKLMPIEVPSAFPKGAPSTFNTQEKAQIDRFINEVPDKNDTRAINYWLDWGNRKVYLEGWIDKCLAGTGLPPMEGGEWDEKIQYMVRVGRRTLTEKQEEKNRPLGMEPGFFRLVEGGFREFEAGDKEWLYGVTWGVYEKSPNPTEKPSYLKEPLKGGGTCYEDAWRFLLKEEEGELVHGSVESDGKRIGHAWVETLTGFIYEPEHKQFWRKAEFEKIAKPKEDSRYTLEQAGIMALRTKNFGPWAEAERKAFLKPPEVTKEPFIYSTGGTNPRYWVKTGEPAHPLHPESFATKAEAEKFLAYIKATGEAIYEAIPEKVIPGITSEKQLPKRIMEFDDIDGVTKYEVRVLAPDRVEVNTVSTKEFGGEPGWGGKVIGMSYKSLDEALASIPKTAKKIEDFIPKAPVLKENVHTVSGFKIPTTRVTSLGIDLEIPVARAVEALVEENPWSSGFHGALNQRWTIVFKGRGLLGQGKISDRAVKAARAAGLEVSYRELVAGSGQIVTDVSLPGVGVSEIEKATQVFNRFAELYEGKPSYLKERTPKAESGSPSYLKEAVAEIETECQLISPQYYDILTWLNVPVPDYSFAIEPEVKERKIDEVLQKLKDGVSRIHESAIFKEFLTTMAKFWDYSIGNQILIMIQRPSATRVAGFVTWKDLGRYVKKGESGIAILAPCLPPRILKCPLCEKTFTERELRTHLVEVHQREDVSILVREAREEAAGIPTPTYFKVVYVFDVAQTEGKPLPEVKVPVLTGAYSKDLYDRLMGLATKQGLTVSFEPKPSLSPEIKGSLLEKDIWIKPDESEAQRLKTLAHETAHHFTEHVYFIPRADAEVIAESVAFTVCAHFGFDSGIRSFPYVALWAKERKVLEQNLANIRKISGRMIEELEK